MIRVTTVLNKDNINKVRFIVNGSPSDLSPISRMDLWIPELNLTITDSDPDAYPLKWEHDPADIGLLEMKLGLETELINKYIISTTGDITSGANTIENIPADKFSQLDKRMLAYGTGLGSSSEITLIKNSTSIVTLNVPSTVTSTGVSLQFFDATENNIHVGKLYIYNPTYTNGFHWADFEIKVDIGL